MFEADKLTLLAFHTHVLTVHIYDLVKICETRNDVLIVNFRELNLL